MNPITSPLGLHSQGPDVANLQADLLLLLERGVLRVEPVAARELAAKLKAESADSTYGAATAKIVAIFQSLHQEIHGLEGAVDDATAQALNAVLRELGALDPLPGERPSSVSGVIQGDGVRPV